MAGIISAGVVALTLMVLTPFFRPLPNAVLASVVIMAVAGLVDVRDDRVALTPAGRAAVGEFRHAPQTPEQVRSMWLGALDQGQFRSLAGSLGVNAFFLAKIRDRTIVPDTIPRGFRLKVADANYQTALDNVRSLKAALQDRRAAFELAQKKLADAVVKAPVAGSVSERVVQPGEYIRENTPVATIVQMNPLKLKTAIQERHAGLIRPGQVVEFYVEAFPNRRFTGRIAYVSPAVDQATRTFAVEALVENSDRVLKPGFFAKGIARTHVDDNVIAAPDDAISTLAGVSTVYVINDGKARQQQVTLGARQDKLVEITSGLKGDETLATTNLSQLATGVTVRVGRPGEDNPDQPGGGPRQGGEGRGGRRGARQ